MSLSLTNTRTRGKEQLHPFDPKQVRLYTCGPTVYHFAHIGNLRAYVFADLLRRTLREDGYGLRQVMNITDVGHLVSDADEGEDKMAVAAKRERKSAWDIARFYEAAFLDDLDRLNIERPEILARATEHIRQQIELVQTLEKNGHTYRIADGIYFDTATVPDYGALAGQKLAEKEAGARVTVNSEKRRPADFALWKFSPAGSKREMEWESPWGRGFPGWHLECSAMSMHYLGDHIDLHTGGEDHIPIHHTNEIAQNQGAVDHQVVNVWMHVAFLRMAEGKMSKSEGNILTLAQLIEHGYDPLAYRYLLLLTHYRKPLTFSWESLDQAQAAFRNLQDKVAELGDDATVGCAEFEGRFRDAMNDDLNAPQALAVLWDLLKSDYPPAAKKRSVLAMDRILGLKLGEVKAVEIPRDVKNLVADREAARASNDFAKSDELRAAIAAKGFTVDDTPDGPVVRPKR